MCGDVPIEVSALYSWFDGFVIHKLVGLAINGSDAHEVSPRVRKEYNAIVPLIGFKIWMENFQGGHFSLLYT